VVAERTREFMREGFICLLVLFLLADSPAAVAEDSVTPESAAAKTALQPVPSSFDEVIDRVIAREQALLAEMRNRRPLVETYLQDFKSDADGNATLVKDQYYLGRLQMSNGPEDISFLGQPGLGKIRFHRRTTILDRSGPIGFAEMLMPDPDLYKKNYKFKFVRREFLGEVRCLVIDVEPKPDAPPGRFEGRMWVEDRDYNIVRFNGAYGADSGHPRDNVLRFDSWRLNLQPGLWLPAYIYAEESDWQPGVARIHLKAQTRFWGYDLTNLARNPNQEFTKITMESNQPVRDESGADADATPVVAARMWERQAEDNAIERLQETGLLAPQGQVDRILEQVVKNLLIANNIDLQSDLHCRVLLTAPLESFTIGHTIVVSRGLLDVLPDEASLAVIVAHELSHVILGHRSDPKLAFSDQMFFPDEQSFQRLNFMHRPAEEEAADTKALELLENSPYKEKLGAAGLFLKVLQQKAPDLPNLIHPHLGNGLAAGESIRMSALLASAPQLDEHRTDQIAALPLGARIKLDPWSDQVEFTKAHCVPLVLAREKMPFEITPFFPYLTIVGHENNKVAAVDPPSK